MYQDYYGLVEPPFCLTPDPKYLFQSPSHQRAFQLLQYGLQRREGLMVLHGDAGSGKTTLCRAVLDSLDRRTGTALLFNPFLSETDLIRAILQDFGLPAPWTAKPQSLPELTGRLAAFLLSRHERGGRAVVVIDEAQNLPLGTLEQVRQLSNLETRREKLLQIILAGQSNLTQTLERPELRPLAQRVSIRCELSPLSKHESAAYLRHRLAVAGGLECRVAFSADGVTAIHGYADGIPRVINLLADRSLMAGMAANVRRINARCVHEAAGTLQLERLAAPLLSRMRAAAPLRRAVAAMGFSALRGL